MLSCPCRDVGYPTPMSCSDQSTEARVSAAKVAEIALKNGLKSISTDIWRTLLISRSQWSCYLLFLAALTSGRCRRCAKSLDYRHQPSRHGGHLQLVANIAIVPSECHQIHKERLAPICLNKGTVEGILGQQAWRDTSHEPKWNFSNNAGKWTWLTSVWPNGSLAKLFQQKWTSFWFSWSQSRQHIKVNRAG